MGPLSPFLIALESNDPLPVLSKEVVNEDRTDQSDRPPVETFRGVLRSWRYLFWIMGLALLVLLYYAEENWRGQRAWGRFAQDMQARGEPTDVASLVPMGVPDEENFAMTPLLAGLYNSTAGGYNSSVADRLRNSTSNFNCALSALNPPKTVRSNSWVGPATDFTAWYKAYLEGTQAAARRERSNGGRSAPGPETNAPALSQNEAAARMLTMLAETDGMFRELRAASQRPYSRFKVHYLEGNPAELALPHLAPVKGFCQVLRFRASARIALGQSDQALEDVQLLFKLAESSRDEPILISHLVRIAETHLLFQPIAEGLAGGQWTEPQLKAMQRALERLDFLPDTRRVLQGERIVFGCGVIDYLRNRRKDFDAVFSYGTGGQESEPRRAIAAAVLRFAPSGWYDFEKLSMSRFSQETVLPAIDLAGKQIRPSAVRKAEKQVSAAVDGSPIGLVLRHRYFSSLMMPASSGFLEKAALAQTSVNLAALACALERYRMAQGRYPESLDALVPQFMARLPQDVVNGQPLHYRLEPGGQYTAYSVGWNETDDGGTVGMTRSGENVDPKTGDWVWRPLVGNRK